MGNRGGISDYPEHLNPFNDNSDAKRFWKSRTGSFRDSLRNTFSFKSFKTKKKEREQPPSSSPQLRKHLPPSCTQRQTFPSIRAPIQSAATPELLPRSRFSERVFKTISENHETEMSNRDTLLNETAKDIPERWTASNILDRKPEKPKRVRRKRRAPLPPNMSREEGDLTSLNVSSLHNYSKWSLTSIETENPVYSEKGSTDLVAVNQDIFEIMNITKEMEKMADSTTDINDGCIQTKEDNNQKSDIPDLIASMELSKKVESRLNQCTVETKQQNENSIDSDENVVLTIVGEVADESRIANDENQPSVQHFECDINRNMVENINNSGNSTFNQMNITDNLNFNERKMLYITGSNDQLDELDSLSNIINALGDDELLDKEKDVPAPSSPKCKTEINVILETSLGDTIDRNIRNTKIENNKPPIPKTRTNKPTKSDLLGNEVIIEEH